MNWPRVGPGKRPYNPPPARRPRAGPWSPDIAQATLTRPPAQPAVAERARRRAIRWEPLALVALLLFAALVRLPYLWDVPQFTDESLESIRAYRLYQGRILPLHSVAPYIGPFQTYLEAAAFGLFGPNIYFGRALVWIEGALAIAAVYFLAREMIGWPAAWLAAALMVTSGVHAGGNSHVNWSQMTAPLFLAIAFGLLYRAVTCRSGPSLLGAGFAFGLGLQTAMTNVAYLPGAALYLLTRWPAVLRTRWPYLAAALFLVGYGNMVAYNLTSDFESFRAGQARDAAYGDYQVRDLITYLTNAGRIGLTLLRSPAGAVDARPEAIDYLTDPVVLIYAGLTAAGVVMLARRGNTLPAWLILSTALLMPIFGARHELLPRQGRYLSSLLPLMFTALAFAVWQLGQILNRRLVEQGVSLGLRRALGAVAVLLLVLYPLLPLQRYYADAVAAGETNERFFRLLDEIEASRPNGEFVLLDFQLAQEQLGGGGTALRTIDNFLTLRGVPHDDLTFDLDRLARRYRDGGIVVVIGQKTFGNLGAQLPLEPVPPQEAVTPPEPYGVYRLGPFRGP